MKKIDFLTPTLMTGALLLFFGTFIGIVLGLGWVLSKYPNLFPYVFIGAGIFAAWIILFTVTNNL